MTQDAESTSRSLWDAHKDDLAYYVKQRRRRARLFRLWTSVELHIVKAGISREWAHLIVNELMRHALAGEAVDIRAEAWVMAQRASMLREPRVRNKVAREMRSTFGGQIDKIRLHSAAEVRLPDDNARCVCPGCGALVWAVHLNWGAKANTTAVGSHGLPDSSGEDTKTFGGGARFIRFLAIERFEDGTYSTGPHTVKGGWTGPFTHERHSCAEVRAERARKAAEDAAQGRKARRELDASKEAAKARAKDRHAKAQKQKGKKRRKARL